MLQVNHKYYHVYYPYYDCIIFRHISYNIDFKLHIADDVGCVVLHHMRKYVCICTYRLISDRESTEPPSRPFLFPFSSSSFANMGERSRSPMPGAESEAKDAVATTQQDTHLFVQSQISDIHRLLSQHTGNLNTLDQRSAKPRTSSRSSNSSKHQNRQSSLPGRIQLPNATENKPSRNSLRRRDSAACTHARRH